MTNENRNIGWGLWIQWVLAYAISFILAWEQLWGAGKGSAIDAFLGRYMSYIIFGLITGFGQWLVLRRYGFSIGWVFATAIPAIIPLNLATIIGSVFLQTIILSRHTYGAFVWILAYIPIWGLILFGGELLLIPPIRLMIKQSGYQSHTVHGIITGVIGALITGTVLVWLLRHLKT